MGAEILSTWGISIAVVVRSLINRGKMPLLQIGMVSSIGMGFRTQRLTWGISIALINHSLDLTLECIDVRRSFLLILRISIALIVHSLDLRCSAGNRDLEKISMGSLSRSLFTHLIGHYSFH